MVRSLTRPFAVLVIAAGALALQACSQDKIQAKIASAAQPGGSDSLTNGDPKAAAATLTKIAKAMLSFHADTGGWPYGDTAWYAKKPNWRRLPNVQIDSVPSGPYDTALFSLPHDIGPCDSTHTGGYNNPCWRGPYLSGAPTDALGAGTWLDPWGHSLMFSYIRPSDALGGGIDRTSSLEGLVFIWSKGHDGLDGFACSDGSSVCLLDINQLSQGLPSQKNADDLVVEVANSSCATATCTETP